MFRSGNFEIDQPCDCWKFLNFKIFEYPLEQLIPNRPPKHVITSTNYES